MGKWTPTNRDVRKFNSLYDQTTMLSILGYSFCFVIKQQPSFDVEVLLFLKDKYKWQNLKSTKARRTRGRVTEEEPEMFGDNAIPRPSGVPRKTKSQRSSASSSATSSTSSKNWVTELMQEQILA